MTTTTTTYGTIPTSESSSSSIQFVSRAKDRIRSGLGTRRPWKEMASAGTISLPKSFSDSISRIRTNVAYFQTNYAIAVLFVLFLCLLWHPISLIVFAVTMSAWIFLYFLRDEPLVVFRRTVGDGSVLAGLSAVTVVLLFLTDATWNIVIGLLVGVAVVLVHAAVRNAGDLFVDEGEDGLGGGGGGWRLPLKETASSSFSSSP